MVVVAVVVVVGVVVVAVAVAVVVVVVVAVVVVVVVIVVLVVAVVVVAAVVVSQAITCTVSLTSGSLRKPGFGHWIHPPKKQEICKRWWHWYTAPVRSLTNGLDAFESNAPAVVD